MKLLYKNALVALLSLCSAVANAATWNVEVREFEFDNNPVNVAVGDVIHWEWQNGSHTTTSTSVPSGAASWDQPINASSQTFDYVVTHAGVYNYHCTPHASMGMTATFVATGTSTAVTATPFDNAFNAVMNDNGTLSLTYVLAASSRADVALFDLTGKMVRQLSNAENAAGLQSQEFPLSGLNRGMYFVVAQIGERRYTQRVIVR